MIAAVAEWHGRVATATRSKVMRVYNKSELFEPRRQALIAWEELLRAQVV